MRVYGLRFLVDTYFDLLLGQEGIELRFRLRFFLSFLGSRCCAHASPRAKSISLSLGTTDFSLRVALEDCRKGWILMFFGISRFIFSPLPHTLYKLIVTVKAMIDIKAEFTRKVAVVGGFIFETGSACSLNGNITVDLLTLLLEQVCPRKMSCREQLATRNNRVSSFKGKWSFEQYLCILKLNINNSAEESFRVPCENCLNRKRELYEVVR